MIPLDFSALADEQLVELVRSACAEAIRRGAGVEAAARGAILDETERAQILAVATHEEARRLERLEAQRLARETAEELRHRAEHAAQSEAAAATRALWLRRKQCAQRILDLLGPVADPREWTFTVWAKEGDKRIYIDGPAPSRKSDPKKITLFVTGNARSAPGKLETQQMKEFWGDSYSDKVKEAKEVCQFLAVQWNHLRATRLSDALEVEAE